MGELEYKHALETLGQLVAAAHSENRHDEAYTLLVALKALCARANAVVDHFLPLDYATEIEEYHTRLAQALANMHSDVTPELFIAGIRKDLIEDRHLPRGPRPSFEQMIMIMWETQRKKGADYGSSEDPLANLKESEEWGTPAWENAFGRIGDKRRRIVSYIRKGYTLANEKPYDAFLDFSTYAVHMWRLFCEWLATREGVKVEVGDPIEYHVQFTNPVDE